MLEVLKLNKMKIKKILIIFFTCLIVNIISYESGWEFESSDLHEILKYEIYENKNEWKETHCKTTVLQIIELFERKGFIKKLDKYSNDLNIFIKSKLGNKLLTKNKDPQHLLFYVNLCASAHVMLIEKKSDENECWCRIFQSWQDKFSIAQWVGLDEFEIEDETLQSDFKNFGNGKKIEVEIMLELLNTLIKSFKDRMQTFKEAGLSLPYELEVIMFQIN